MRTTPTPEDPTPEAVLTPNQVAKSLCVAPGTVYRLIRAGKLPAMDLSLRQGTGRPRYRILPADLAAFLRTRSVLPPAPRPATRRRQRRPTVVEQFV